MASKYHIEWAYQLDPSKTRDNQLLNMSPAFRFGGLEKALPVSTKLAKYLETVDDLSTVTLDDVV